MLCFFLTIPSDCFFRDVVAEALLLFADPNDETRASLETFCFRCSGDDSLPILAEVSNIDLCSISFLFLA